MPTSEETTQHGVVNANVSSSEKDALFQVMSHLQLAIEGCQGSLTELEQWKSRAMTAELMNEQFAKTIDDCTRTMDSYERQLASWKTRALLAEESLRNHGHNLVDGSGNYNVTKTLVESNFNEEKSDSSGQRTPNEEKRDEFLDEALADTDEESCYSNLVSDDGSASMSSEPEMKIANGAKGIFRRKKWERHEMVKINAGKV